ncbi:hypothetical protein [Mesorhizobium sp. WSM2561]|uniref:hypothetical protein n=1 Tax=Mesorhizobium sp. WSM2561 TaxID=1040985 RepID=UPI00047F3F90|nr:hypothetical protein [Mesorhizobium sp. WSM2561]
MIVNWSEVATYRKAGEEVTAPWLMALESLGDATHLKIEAEGEWKPAGSVLPACGPDGLASLTLPDTQLILPGCWFGALIGKLGGSSAIHHIPEPAAAALVADEPFAIGAFCMLKLPQDTFGPLFISFNVRSRPVSVTALKVKISGARPTA